MLQRVKEVQESDLRMVGALARNIQRVIAVTQADIDAAAAQGRAWIVKPVVKVSDPLDNLRGGTQLVIKQNTILPGQNVMRVMYIGGQAVVVGPGTSPLSLPDATDNDILSLIAFGGTEQRNLPEGYTELEYIQSTGTQYIDTGYKSSNNTKVLARFSTPTYNTFVFGSRKDTSGINQQRFGLYVAQTWNPQYGNSNYSGAGSTTVDTVYNTEMSSAGFVVDGVTLKDFSPETFTGEYNMYMFANNTAGATTGYGQVKIYSFKIYNNNTLVRDFIPAKRNSDDVLGMYDTVNGQFYTNAGTGDFIAGNAVSPTPDAPMDIVCNNGVLKARHQSGLPLGYTLLDYIESTGTQYIDTGLINNSGAITATAVFSVSAFDGMTETYASIFGRNSNFQAGYTRDGKANVGNATSTQVFFTLNTPATVVGVLQSDTAGGYTIDGVSTGLTRVYIPSTPLYIFASESNKYMTKGKMYSFTAEQNGQIIMNLVPAKNSSNVVGMYDTVSGQFFTNAGTGTFTAGNPVSDPVEIYTDGTVETIAIKDDQNTTVSTATCEDLLSVGTYTDEQEVISGGVTRKVGVKVLDGTENWILSGGVGVWANFQSITGVAFGTTSAICSHSAYAGADVTVANMNQNEFSLYTNGNIAFKNSNTTSTSDWATFLADQYAAGTPVTVIYPLSQATTETVTGQPMATTEGDNIAEITQASLSGLELEVEYIKQ